MKITLGIFIVLFGVTFTYGRFRPRGKGGKGCKFVEVDVRDKWQRMENRRMARPWNNTDVIKHNDVYLDDAVVYFPGRPNVVGRKAIDDFWLEWHPIVPKVKIELQHAIMVSKTRVFSHRVGNLVRSDGQGVMKVRVHATWKRVKGSWFIEKDVIVT